MDVTEVGVKLIFNDQSVIFPSILIPLGYFDHVCYVKNQAVMIYNNIPEIKFFGLVYLCEKSCNCFCAANFYCCVYFFWVIVSEHCFGVLLFNVLVNITLKIFCVEEVTLDLKHKKLLCSN